MKKFFRLSVAAVLAASFGSAPVFAQTGPLSEAQISAQCAANITTFDACQGFVTTQVAALGTLGLAAGEFDTRLSNLVILLAELAQLDCETNRIEILKAIQIAQGAATDGDLAAQIAEIGQSVNDCSTIQTAALGVAASPN